MKKKSDLGAFTITSMIGEFSIAKALFDLAQTFNLIHLEIYQQLGLGIPKQNICIY